ncbi:MAG: hypothetical protein PWP27_1074 [Clostridiales bacterium]|jgi:hypothetical protein|nr:hypothetical protein [Clostridiales bacterium]MDK2933264.1 hypothetical protein [Clostridiales bacterium]
MKFPYGVDEMSFIFDKFASFDDNFMNAVYLNNKEILQKP